MRELPAVTPMASGETSAIVASPQTGVRRIVGLKRVRTRRQTTSGSADD